MLFIDDHHIHSSRGVVRRFHRLDKHPDNPVKVFTDPWGSTLANHGGFEIDPATREFVLWYSTRPVDPESVTDARFICQARSGDGVHWETPPLGLFEFRGSRDNNICVVNYPYSGVYPGPHELTGPCIARDPLDPDPSARYKMALWRYNRDHDPETGKRLYESKDTPYPTGLYTSASPDGIHWPARERLVHTHADGFGDTCTWMLDTLRGGYRLFGKRLYWDNRWASGKVLHGEPGTWVRLRHTCWSPDFASWSPHVPILPIDGHDRPRDQVYMNNGFVYDDMYLGFAQILHALDDWSMDLDLACSRDGEEWLRPPGARCIVPRGEGTAWDSGRMAILPSAPVLREGRLHFYYTSGAHYHSPAPRRELPPGSEKPTGLCLATLRQDGFAGMRAEGEGGIIRTRPLRIDHPDLLVNVDAGGDGSCRVGLLDEGGAPLAGYGPEDMEAIRGDHLGQPLRWRDRESVAGLHGRWITLEVELQGAELFAIHNRNAAAAG